MSEKIPKPRTVDRALERIERLTRSLYDCETGRCGVYGWGHSGLAHVTGQSYDSSNTGRAYADDGTPVSPVAELAATSTLPDRLRWFWRDIQEAEAALQRATRRLAAAKRVMEGGYDHPAAGGWVQGWELALLKRQRDERIKSGGGLGET